MGFVKVVHLLVGQGDPVCFYACYLGTVTTVFVAVGKSQKFTDNSSSL